MVEIRTVSTARFEMEYVSFGHGPHPLVLVPGMSLHSVMEQKDSVAFVYKPFYEDFTVYLIDRIKNMPAGYTVEDMARDTAEGIISLGLSDIDMIGYSQGGMIAMRIAGEHPDLVHKLILGSTSAYPGEKAKSIIGGWSVMAAEGDVKKVNKDMFAHIYSDAYRKKYALAFSALENKGTKEEMDRLSILAAACVTHDARGLLDRIKCPVFVICSSQDKLFPPADSEYLAAAFGGRLYVYEGYSHAVYDEAPDFKSRMLGFLTE